MPHVASFDHHVRSYEIDIYGHVNNAVYTQWLEHGRARLLADKGLSFVGVRDLWNVMFVTVHVTLDYRRQIRLGDDVRVETRVKRYGRTSVTFDQRVIRIDADGSQTLAAEGSSTIVFTDPGMTTAVPIPAEFRALYGEPGP